jgi:hypothetical protein
VLEKRSGRLSAAIKEDKLQEAMGPAILPLWDLLTFNVLFLIICREQFQQFRT